VKHPKVLNPTQREEMRAAMERIGGAAQAGKPVVLEAESDVGTIGINPRDAQMLESRAFSVEAVSLWFRVPPFMVGHSEKSTSWGTGIEQQMIGFLTFTLRPWLRRIEQAITKDLLLPAERPRYFPKFNVEGLLRGDSAARASFYNTMINAGVMTRDQVRELEDWAPMGGNAAVLTVQSQVVPLDTIGQQQDAAQARAALRAFLGIAEPESDPAQRDWGLTMTKKKLPGVPEGRMHAGVSSQILPRALDRWNPGIQAAAAEEAERSISVYDVIGYDYWTGDGVTAKRVAAALRQMGKGPVTVNVNSPGGDMFEGLAIYNLLREHDGEVTVKVLGLAASAASIIAMAGDTVQIARAGFLMIPNAWVLAAGNRHDLREYADTLEPFDRAMADIYAARTGEDAEAMAKLMDAETWIGG